MWWRSYLVQEADKFVQLNTIKAICDFFVLGAAIEPTKSRFELSGGLVDLIQTAELMVDGR